MEQILINMGLAVLVSAIKNPAHAAQFKAQLVGIANDIYAAYGMVPPAQPSGD